MPKFENKYVHFMWDDELEGKDVFVGNDIEHLIRSWVNGCATISVINSGNIGKPFKSLHSEYCFRFAYYDPYYEMKLAHERGKVIQFHELNDDWDEWLDCENEPDWGYPPERYRIKPEPESNPVTNRELAKWLAQGNGETRVGDVAFHDNHYCIEDGERPVSKNTLVRKWDGTEWRKPTREYMGLDKEKS